MPAAPRSPLDGTDHLVVDGTNLLYRLGSGTAAPPAAIIGRLRAAIPAAVTIDLIFDGIAHGIKGRVAQQMFVRYAGRSSGDQLIMDIAAEGARAAGGGPAATARVLVVTNDRELRARLDLQGVRSVPLVWLTNRLDMPRLSSAAPGNRRPTIGAGQPATPAGAAPEAERQGWKPGRGATAKTGTAHKIARHKRHPRHGA
jgi:rRNA-processing protein FCF1